MLGLSAGEAVGPGPDGTGLPRGCLGLMEGKVQLKLQAGNEGWWLGCARVPHLSKSVCLA